MNREDLKPGIDKALKNSEDLFEEGLLLRQHSKISRAFYLFHMAIEECSKAEIITREWHAYSYKENKVRTDSSELKKQFNTHEAKNKLVASLEEFSEDEELARQQNDHNRLIEAFEKTQILYNVNINGLKNAALYVDISKEKFISPGEVITEEIMNKEMERAREWIALIKFSIEFRVNNENNIIRS